MTRIDWMRCLRWMRRIWSHQGYAFFHTAKCDLRLLKPQKSCQISPVVGSTARRPRRNTGQPNQRLPPVLQWFIDPWLTLQPLRPPLCRLSLQDFHHVSTCSWRRSSNFKPLEIKPSQETRLKSRFSPMCRLYSLRWANFPGKILNLRIARVPLHVLCAFVSWRKSLSCFSAAHTNTRTGICI